MENSGKFSYSRKKWCNLHSKNSCSNEECYHQKRRNKSKGSSTVDGKTSEKYKTFAEDITPIGYNGNFNYCSCRETRKPRRIEPTSIRYGS